MRLSTDGGRTFRVRGRVDRCCARPDGGQLADLAPLVDEVERAARTVEAIASLLATRDV